MRGLIFGLALFLAIEWTVFHSRIYPSILTPDSSTGMFELVLSMERENAATPARRVVAIGDSRQALREALANQIQTAYRFSNAAVGGTTPRCWYYQLREMDPQRDHYKAILIPVEGYDDEDEQDDLANRLTDLRFLVARLGLADIPEFVGSYSTFENGWRALLGVLLKGTVYKQDLQELLQDPSKRMIDLDVRRAHWRKAIRTYHGDHRDLTGLGIDWKAWRAVYPERLSARARKFIEDILLWKPITQTGRTAAYRRKWFGRIIDRYQGSGTKLIFYRMPRAPIVRPDGLVRKESASIRELAARPGARVLDEHAFDELEAPRYFYDPQHLNAEGKKRYTETLVRRVTEALGGANAL